MKAVFQGVQIFDGNTLKSTRPDHRNVPATAVGHTALTNLELTGGRHLA